MIPGTEPARAIGEAVLRTADHYERETGKSASTIVIHLADKLPNLSKDSPPKPGTNQYHYGFTVEVQHDSGPSKTT